MDPLFTPALQPVMAGQLFKPLKAEGSWFEAGSGGCCRRFTGGSRRRIDPHNQVSGAPDHGPGAGVGAGSGPILEPP